MNPRHYAQVCQVTMPVFYNTPTDENISLTNSSELKLVACRQFPNAFVLQLFGLGKKCDPRRIIRYLFTSFTAFRDRDYCLLAISVTIHTSPAMFELLKVMVVSNHFQLYLTQSEIVGTKYCTRCFI